MQKMLNSLNKNKYWILVIILYILLFIQMQNVYMYADDYDVVFRLDSFDTYISIITREMNRYFNYWSGRLIGHFTVISGLSIFGMNFFRFLNPLIIFIICLFISKIIKFKLDISLSKLIFWLTISILGMEVFITRECLYWADGTILYLWGYVPLIINIYMILKAFYKDKRLTLFEFIICILLCTIINFTMESTQVFNLIFLFLFIAFNYNKCLKNKKIFLIFLYTIIIFILSFFIPGNLSRFYESSFTESTLLTTIMQRMYLFIRKLLTCKFSYYLFIISNIILTNLSINKLKYKKIFVYLLFILNLFNGLNIIFNFATENNFNSIYFTIYVIYILIITIVGYSCLFNSKNLIHIFIASICSSIFSVVLTPYWCTRFYWIYVLSSIIFIIYFCISSSEKNKLLILLSIIFCLNIKIFLFLLILLLIKKLKNLEIINVKCISLLIITIIFINNFINTIYYYHKNVSTFKYNNYILENKISNQGDIYLKKLPYTNYSFDLPYMEAGGYMIHWFNNYYDVDTYNIIWED